MIDNSLLEVPCREEKKALHYRLTNPKLVIAEAIVTRKRPASQPGVMFSSVPCPTLLSLMPALVCHVEVMVAVVVVVVVAAELASTSTPNCASANRPAI